MSFSDNPKKLENQLRDLKTRWNIHTNSYVATFPDAKMEVNTVPNDRAYNAVMKVMGDIRLLDAHLKSKVSTSTNFLINMDKRISNIKDKYGKEKVTLDSILANNVAGKPLKVDKYDENSQSYVYSSYYIIGILTMSFFIYKQLKQ
jgi:hypothetical protein